MKAEYRPELKIRSLEKEKDTYSSLALSLYVVGAASGMVSAFNGFEFFQEAFNNHSVEALDGIVRAAYNGAISGVTVWAGNDYKDRYFCVKKYLETLSE